MRVNIVRILFVVITLFPVIAYSADNGITVRDPWIREAPPNAVALAGYMVLENPSDKEQSLVDATSDAFGSVMIHRTVHEGGMARMKHQNAVSIPAKGNTAFEPDGYHLMLMKPRQALQAGAQVPVELIFANGSQLSITFEVRKGMPKKGGMREMKCGGGMKCGGKNSGKEGMRCGGSM
ncbi:MAG: copper chaperone PCu(A)C [Gammaproteobacteria bacterium]|nr:MAG: copper chaperone PCu(A)C [Gammaproteobacteria bacterium]